MVMPSVEGLIMLLIYLISAYLTMELLLTHTNNKMLYKTVNLLQILICIILVMIYGILILIYGIMVYIYFSDYFWTYVIFIMFIMFLLLFIM